MKGCLQEQLLDFTRGFCRTQKNVLLSLAIYLVYLHPLNQNRSKCHRSILKWWQIQSAQYLRKYLWGKLERSGKDIPLKGHQVCSPEETFISKLNLSRSQLLYLDVLSNSSPSLIPDPDPLCYLFCRHSQSKAAHSKWTSGADQSSISPKVHSLSRHRGHHIECDHTCLCLM